MKNRAFVRLICTQKPGFWPRLLPGLGEQCVTASPKTVRFPYNRH